MIDRSNLKITPVLFACLVFWFAGDVAAQQKKVLDQHDLATKATSPVGTLIQLQLQDTYTPDPALVKRAAFYPHLHQIFN